MRKLASIQTISALQPIEGKDRIELATVLGWQVIVQKGLYTVGDLVVYCEIDSQFPAAEWCSELEKFKYRIKTFTVNTPSGKIYSQGYCIPFSRFKEIVDTYTTFWDELDAAGFEGSIWTWNPGDDVTNLLGITKYELPDNFANGEAAGKFPTHIVPITDEPRVQSNLFVLDDLKGKPYVIRQKIDGTSWTAGQDQGIPFVCSRGLMLKHPLDSGKKCSYWDVFDKYNFTKILGDMSHLVFQGELYGEGIQKNPLGIKGKELVIFNIWDCQKKQYVDDRELELLSMAYGFRLCPVIERGIEFWYTLDDLIKLSMEQKYPNGKPAEGIVIRPQKEEWCQGLNSRLSFKCINPIFLDKKGE